MYQVMTFNCYQLAGVQEQQYAEICLNGTATHSLTHSITHTRSLTHLLTYSLTHSLTSFFRLILDIELSAEEVKIVQEALPMLEGFVHDDPYFSRPSSSILGVPFTKDVKLKLAKNEVDRKVLAVTQVIGTLFTQGVNEMQTLSNMSYSHKVKIQGISVY